MTIAHLLEDFGMATSAPPEDLGVSEEVVEATRLASFENGYSAGWEDAVAAKDKEATQVSTNLATSLEDLSFTYHEAQSQLIEALDPMFKVLTSAVLPDAMAASFGHHIVDQLADMARSQTDQGMEIVVSAGEGAPVRALLSQEFSVPVKVQEDKDLQPGQAYLRVGATERELNSDGLIESVKDSVDAFTYHFKEESQYG
ncbi:ABC transporter ATP-binding protein [Epibacterium ulvae]|uniref:Flagellar assembly protein FliH n=1 Tax=Epibacterium ulvae TaxID=1156985 RepID=A0A1G5RJD6_9RHOB|nr:ABC transporter ATP-binding protein [Epibacterium ulvae]SCZ73988.1 flagellar assembly protein FliH [Epibacterium ulvae]